MRKFLRTTKALLVAAGLCVGANAWGDVTTAIYSNDYENATTTDWKAQNVTPILITADGNSYTKTPGATGGNRTSYLSFGNSTSLGTGQSYVIEFRFQTTANYGWNSNNAYYKQYTQIYSSTTSVTTSGNSNNGADGKGYNSRLALANCIVSFENVSSNPTNTFTIYAGSNSIENTVNSNSTTWEYTASTWYTVKIEGDGDGVSITIKDSDSNTVFSGSQSFAEEDNIGYPTGILYLSCRNTNADNTYGGFDDISLSYKTDLSSYLSRMSDAKTSGNALSTKIMNTTVMSTLASALASEYVDMEEANITSSNIDAYISALEALESAVSDAQTSINNFIILNNLIGKANTYAETVTSYEAPSGAATVYTENADVDPVALAAAIRNEIARAGVEHGDNTDLTALIANNSFELGNTLGWTVIPSVDTGVRTSVSPYVTEGIDGTYLFNIWPFGYPITQTIGTLPAGTYQLKALTATGDGEDTAEKTGKVYLIMNGSHNDGLSAYNGNIFGENTFEFTLATSTEVTIGVVGSNNDEDDSYNPDGHWWYKADNFTLKYVGQDAVALAKASLEAEIETATTLYDSWTPKVGTAPFKYDATYYNALGTQITTATSVLNGGSTTASDYTNAESTLETAEGNMGSSTQNAPDADKYYRIFVANNDGTASDYNLNMLYETTMTQVKVTSMAYPVKFVASTSYAGRYRIQTPYSNNLCTTKSALTTAYVSSADGVEVRLADISISLQDNGTVKMSSTNSGNSYYYAASASENANVTAATGNTGTWVVSDAVEVSNTSLSVNATAGWGTFIAPYDNLTPSTVKAYTVSYTENNVVYFTENETGVLSANTPYILSTEESENVSTTFTGIANNNEDTYTVNGLVGLLTASTVAADKYILQNNDGVVGFYKTTEAITGTANRCYLDLASVPTEASSARAFVSFGIFDGDATGIKSVEGSQLNTEGFYNLSGQRISQPTKGLYIVDGKKVIVK